MCSGRMVCGMALCRLDSGQGLGHPVSAFLVGPHSAQLLPVLSASQSCPVPSPQSHVGLLLLVFTGGN